MNIQTRNERMLKSKLSIVALAQKYNLSYERTRQIIKKEDQSKKEVFFTIEKEYLKNVKKLIKTNLGKEIERVSKNKSKKLVIQKKILIGILRDKYGFTFSYLANQFGCSNANVFYHYTMYKNKIKR